MVVVQDHERGPSVLVRLCSLCIEDAGHRCGMIGAARCPHIEEASGGHQPVAWSLSGTGIWCCIDFDADIQPEPSRYVS